MFLVQGSRECGAPNPRLPFIVIPLAYEYVVTRDQGMLQAVEESASREQRLLREHVESIEVFGRCWIS